MSPSWALSFRNFYTPPYREHRRNETLRLWKERNSLIEAFVNLLNVVIGPLNAVREA